MSSGLKRIRVFVCVMQNRHDGASCAEQGSLDLVDALCQEIAQIGNAAASIDVRPCGCLGICEQGPALLAVGGKAALDTKPPKGFLNRLLCSLRIQFTHARLEDAHRIVEELVNVAAESR
jgi:hypothetical protein